MNNFKTFWSLGNLLLSYESNFWPNIWTNTSQFCLNGNNHRHNWHSYTYYTKQETIPDLLSQNALHHYCQYFIWPISTHLFLYRPRILVFYTSTQHFILSHHSHFAIAHTHEHSLKQYWIAFSHKNNFITLSNFL